MEGWRWRESRREARSERERSPGVSQNGGSPDLSPEMVGFLWASLANAKQKGLTLRKFPDAAESRGDSLQST